MNILCNKYYTFKITYMTKSYRIKIKENHLSIIFIKK